MNADQTQPNLPCLDWRSSAYETTPIADLQSFAEQCPAARTDVGYSILTREWGRPVMFTDRPITVYHIPETLSPYLAESTKQPLLTRHGPEHASLRSMLPRVLRAPATVALRPQIPATALRVA